MNLLGLYLGLKTPDLPSTNSQAAIIIRKDTNKWVLVHEYLHHLFQIQAEKEGYDENALKKNLITWERELNSSMSSLKFLTGETRRMAVKTSVENLVKLNHGLAEFLKHYMLEEMTIETVLGERMDSRELTLVHGKQRLNGAAYIIVSSNRVKDLFSGLEKDADTLQKENSSYLDSSQMNDLRSIRSTHSSLFSEMATLKARAEKYLQSQGLVFKGLETRLKGLAPSSEHDEPIGCSHSQIPEEIVEGMSRLESRRSSESVF